LNPG